jgi:hypothetical protein
MLPPLNQNHSETLPVHLFHFVCGSFNDTVRNSDGIASNGRITGEYWTTNNTEGSGYGLV